MSLFEISNINLKSNILLKNRMNSEATVTVKIRPSLVTMLKTNFIQRVLAFILLFFRHLDDLDHGFRNLDFANKDQNCHDYFTDKLSKNVYCTNTTRNKQAGNRNLCTEAKTYHYQYQNCQVSVDI